MSSRRIRGHSVEVPALPEAHPPPPPPPDDTMTSQEVGLGLGTDERRVDDSDKNGTGMTPEAIRTAVLEALSDPVVIRGVLSAVQAAGNTASPDTGSGTNSSGVVADGESSNVCSN